MADADQSNLTMLTVDLLSAFVANNSVEYSSIPDLIKSTHAALKMIDSPEAPSEIEPEHKPAVTVRKSLSSDAHILSLIDGKPYQTLKRHLSGHGLTPDEYRERYGLPKSYPMVSKSYSESRRAIAEKLGLGRRVKGVRDEGATPASSDESLAPTLVEPAKRAVAKAKKTASSTPAKAKASRAVKVSPAVVEAPTDTESAKPVKVRKAPVAKAPDAPAKPARKRPVKSIEPAA